jgi:acetyl esterase/lipase
MSGFAQEEILLYEEVPEMKKTELTEKIDYDEKGRLKRISFVLTPRLIVFPPEKPCGTAVIICPGGGYRSLNIENTRFISERLNAVGVTTFVLVYRLPSSEIMLNPSIAGLQDVQEAFRLVRRRAAEWGLQTDKIGLWGSSAGGHLAAMAATHYLSAFEKDKPTAGLRPDFLILAWPVVTFRAPYVHKGSMYNLLGPAPTGEQLAFYSPEEHITNDTPPTFLVHASNDPAVPAYNSISFFSKLIEAGIRSELHIYESDKHGFGITPDEQDSWMSQLFVWMKNQNLLKH